MKRKTLPLRTLLLWQIRVVMLTAVLILICFYFVDVLPLLKIVILVLSILGFLAVAWYLPTFFKSYELLFQKDSVIINYGVFIKVTHIMPYPRLIYAQSFATPLARLFGVTAISLKAARSRVIVPELLLSDAKRYISSLAGEVTYDK